MISFKPRGSGQEERKGSSISTEKKETNTTVMTSRSPGSIGRCHHSMGISATGKQYDP
jgi:hypothetical protein